MASLEKLDAQHRIQGHKINERLPEMIQRFPHMAKEQYVYQGQENDLFFHHAYNHLSGSNCLGCRMDMVVKRVPRESNSPRIHYGTIGSANIVVKDGNIREKLKKDLSIQ